MPRSPQWMYQIWSRGTSRGRNQLCGIFLQSAHGFRFCEGSNFAISHWLGRSPLTQCWRYRAACDLYLSQQWRHAKKFRYRVLVMRYLRVAVMHLPTKFWANSSIQFGVIDIFPKFKMAAAAILDFQFMWIWPFRCGICVLYQIWFKYLL